MSVRDRVVRWLRPRVSVRISCPRRWPILQGRSHHTALAPFDPAASLAEYGWVLLNLRVHTFVLQLVAYEEHGRVLPVVSDFDAFLIGSTGVDYPPMPRMQARVSHIYPHPARTCRRCETHQRD